jgi:hypothetical protein
MPYLAEREKRKQKAKEREFPGFKTAPTGNVSDKCFPIQFLQVF